jgi:hypothetical protein
MSRKFVIGLKITCSQCANEFAAKAKQQRLLFERAPMVCPKCNCMLCLPDNELAELEAKGNPGRPYLTGLSIIGGCGLLFFGSVLAGAIDNEGMINLVVGIYIVAQLVMTLLARAATAHLRITMEKCDSP